MTVVELTVVEREARLAEIAEVIRKTLATPEGVSLEDLITRVSQEAGCFEEDVLEALDRVEIVSRFETKLRSAEA
ncbi:hypothetical protein [Serinicoccus marinus]|uniref:hypothetical protein n=1 Tax=Serinicoccus marinus TaxID=247333 RepID=UPI0024911198|nr:hypothetical protein [Serinicoccus marinus]